MQQDHLRPVPPPEPTGQPEASNESAQPSSSRRRAIPRTTRPLPTDRLKFDAHKQALKAIAISSEFGKQTVGSDAIARALSVAETTAGLNNAFFVDSGLITKEGRGQYRPTEPTNAFARKHSFSDAEAGLLLADTLKKTWYFKAVAQRLQIGPATKPQIIEALAHGAGATAERQSQLDGLLDWLSYAGLVRFEGSAIVIPAAAPSPPPPGGGGANVDEDPPGGPGDDGAGKGATKHGGHTPRQDPVVSMSFEFALTAGDLKQLAPEQIKALFEAVGVLMATKGALS